MQFGSRFPGDPSQTLVVDFLPDRLLRRVRKLDELFLGAYVFDKWTCNCDGRQVVFYRSVDDEDSSYSAWLIDHGFCFNDGEWNFPDHQLRSFYPRRFVYESVRSLHSFEQFLRRIENLELAELQACAREIPREWCGDDPEQLARLLERLYERRRKVRQAIIDARDCELRPFPELDVTARRARACGEGAVWLVENRTICAKRSRPVILSPSFVILSPSFVILSEAKDLGVSLRVNSTKDLIYRDLDNLRDSSSLSAPQNDTHQEFSESAKERCRWRRKPNLRDAPSS